METKKVKIGKRTFKIKEISFFEQLELQEREGGTGNLKTRDILKISIEEPKITDEVLKSISMKEGNQLLKEINKLNGWSKDFQNPQEESGNQSASS